MMLHRTTVHDASRTRRLRGVVLVSALLFASCTDGSDVKGSGSKQHTVDSGAPASNDSGSVDPGSATTGGTTDDGLPKLEDVTTPPWKPQTRTDELAAEIGQKDLTPQQAVDAFALMYPDIPGATPSDLPPGNGLGQSYTWMLIRSVRDKLASDQREFVDTAETSEEIGTINEDGTSTMTALANQEIPGVGDPPPDDSGGTVTTDNTAATNTDDTAVKPGGFIGRRPAGPKQTYARYFRLATAAYNDWLAHRADMPPYTIQLSLSKVKIRGGGMDTGPVRTLAHTCITRVDPGFVASNLSDALIKFWFAHEFFHCIQFQWNPAMDWRIAPWVFDGSADWAAVDVYRSVFVAPPPALENLWFSKPYKPLAERQYDAWALFDTVWEGGVDPIPGIHAMVNGVTSGDVNAALALGGLDGQLFRMKWSSRAYRSTQYPADDWQLSWPGPNRNAGPRENRANDGSRGVGEFDVQVNGGYTHVDKTVQMDSDVGIVDVTPSGGPLTTQTASGVIHVADGSTVRLCFAQDQCKCPEDTESGAQQMSGREIIFSFAASDGPTTAHIEARKWNEATKKEKCKKKMPKRGSSNGDPHLVTMDGQPYDMMTLGEFVTARDPAGDFEVQTRNVAAASIGSGTLSTAVAIKTGEHRVTFTVKDFTRPDGLVVRVDGEPTSEATLEIDGVTVQRQDPNAIVTWPDGSTVELRFDFGYFVTITPSDARAAVLEGLLGSADGDFVNDLRMPDGAIVDPVYAAVPDSAFSKSWRVDSDSSLFDYDDGESVDTFALPYPGDTFEQLLDSAAKDKCTEALGPDAASHEINSCAYDVSVTGNESYVESYRTVVDERMAAEDAAVVVADEPDTVPAGSVVEPTQTGAAALTLSGTLVAAYSDQATGTDVVTSLNGTVAAKSGTVMVFRAERCGPGATLFLNVTQRSSGESGGLFICDPNDLQLALADEDDEAILGEVYLWLPADGDYDIDIDTDGEDPNFVSVEVFVDPEPTIVDGADVTDGYSTTLRGVGDTVVITSPDAGASFTATGLDTACAQEAYGASPIGTDEVWGLAGFCAHGDTVSLPGADVPLVLFSRTDDPVDVMLAPQ